MFSRRWDNTAQIQTIVHDHTKNDFQLWQKYTKNHSQIIQPGGFQFLKGKLFSRSDKPQKLRRTIAQK